MLGEISLRASRNPREEYCEEKCEEAWIFGQDVRVLLSFATFASDPLPESMTCLLKRWEMNDGDHRVNIDDERLTEHVTGGVIWNLEEDVCNCSAIGFEAIESFFTWVTVWALLGDEDWDWQHII